METLELTRTEAEAQTEAGTKTIADFIDGIIEERNSKLLELEKKQKVLDDIAAMLDKFDALKGQIVDAEGNVLPGKYKQFVRQYPAMPLKLQNLDTELCRKRIEEARKELTAVHDRFDRKRINIGIVGMARGGKSKTLQSITGLSDKVIPTSDGSDCTGAVSIIENHPEMGEGEVRATITFKTEKQILDDVQAYLDAIITDPSQRTTVSTLSGVSSLDMNDINRRMGQHSANASKMSHLTDYVEHYEDWAPLVKQGGTIVLENPDQIQPYVAQYNVDDPSESFYQNLAVKSCRIECAFNYRDAGKITLVDTVGLGDTKLGITEDMIHVVRDESDAVILLHKPVNGTGKGIPDYLEKIYKDILNACPDRNLNDWLAWMINWDQRLGHKNGDYTTMAQRTLDEYNYAGSIKEIVDVSDAEKVQAFLIRLLTNMCEHLEKIDELYMGKLENALKNVWVAYNGFCEEAKSVVDSSVGDVAKTEISASDLFDEMQKKMNEGLNYLKDDVRGKRDVPCKTLEKEVAGILQDIESGAMLPDEQTLVEELVRFQDHLSVYLHNVHSLRNKIVQRFSEVDSSMERLTVEVKNSVAQIFLDEEGCRLGRVMPKEPEQQPYEWFRDFAQVHLDKRAYPTLYAAIMKMCGFTFSVNGFLTYEVRACLDELDPDATGAPSFVGTRAKIAGNMRDALDIKLVHVADALDRNLKTLFMKPNRAFYAMVEEFKDQVQHAPNVKREWTRLYAKHFSDIWEEEYRNMVITNDAFGDWDALMREMRQVKKRADNWGKKEMGKNAN